MASSKADLLRLLEAELDFIEGGGYGRPAGEPARETPMFYHSLACINHWLVPGHESECHDDCVLMDFVPQKDRNAEMPCHLIVLNSSGETVKSLEGDQERLEREVTGWLRATIQRLKQSEAPADSPEVKY